MIERARELARTAAHNIETYLMMPGPRTLGNRTVRIRLLSNAHAQLAEASTLVEIELATTDKEDKKE